MDSKKAASIFDKFAESYQDKYMSLELYHDSFDLFCKKIALPAGKILDIACGPGNISKYLLTKHPDYHLRGIDLSENMIQLARRNNPSATFEVMDCQNISTLAEEYDGIVCGFVLPYLDKPTAIKLIADAAQLLSNQGVIYLSTMEGQYSDSESVGPSDGGSDKLFTYYHEEEYLTKALADNGFGAVEVIRFPPTLTVYKSPGDLCLIASKIK